MPLLVAANTVVVLPAEVLEAPLLYSVVLLRFAPVLPVVTLDANCKFGIAFANSLAPTSVSFVPCYFLSG